MSSEKKQEKPSTSGGSKRKQPRTVDERALYMPQQRVFVNLAKEIAEAIVMDQVTHNLSSWTLAFVNANQVKNTGKAARKMKKIDRIAKELKPYFSSYPESSGKQSTE